MHRQSPEGLPVSARWAAASPRDSAGRGGAAAEKRKRAHRLRPQNDGKVMTGAYPDTGYEGDKITVLFAEAGYRTLDLDLVRQNHLLEPVP